MALRSGGGAQGNGRAQLVGGAPNLRLFPGMQRAIFMSCPLVLLNFVSSKGPADFGVLRELLLHTIILYVISFVVSGLYRLGWALDENLSKLQIQRRPSTPTGRL